MLGYPVALLIGKLQTMTNSGIPYPDQAEEEWKRATLKSRLSALTVCFGQPIGKEARLRIEELEKVAEALKQCIEELVRGLK